jgi:hypothetical protein
MHRKEIQKLLRNNYFSLKHFFIILSDLKELTEPDDPIGLKENSTCVPGTHNIRNGRYLNKIQSIMYLNLPVSWENSQAFNVSFPGGVHIQFYSVTISHT